MILFLIPLSLLFINLFLVNQINSVIGIDPTYKLCKENVSLVVFVCVNQYFISELIAICFCSEEKEANYEFALASYIKVGFKQPTIVFTDREKALCNAVEKKFKGQKHFLCIYHIFRNIQQNLGIFFLSPFL